MTNAVPNVRRLWGVIREVSPGRNELVLTGHEPTPADVASMKGALLLTGMIAGDGLNLAIDIISDPSEDPASRGDNGWTPVLAAEQDGTRTLFKVVDWKRSQGEPAAGYLTAGGDLTTVKADAFNFNSIKRVDIFSASTAAGGVATVVFDPPFNTVPVKVLPSAIPNILAGPVKAEVVGAITKAGCQIKVTQMSLLGVLAPLVGASVQVIAIEG